jgi:hypothetical protein
MLANYRPEPAFHPLPRLVALALEEQTQCPAQLVLDGFLLRRPATVQIAASLFWLHLQDFHQDTYRLNIHPFRHLRVLILPTPGRSVIRPSNLLFSGSPFIVQSDQPRPDAIIVVIAGSRVHDRCALLNPTRRIPFVFSLLRTRKRGGNGNHSCDIGRY